MFLKKKKLHGGFECGDNGIWNFNKCVPSYCDNGFIFDKKNNECIKDICIEVEKKSRLFKILGIIFLILDIILIHFCYELKFEKKVFVISFVIGIIFLIVGIVLIIIKDN